MASMRAMQVSEAGGALELVERDVPQPGSGEALVRVHACGICHSDSFAKEGGFPGVSHPLEMEVGLQGVALANGRLERKCAGVVRVDADGA